MLERQEEYLLAKRWREHGDRDAAHKLVTSHLRLVTKIARDYRGCLSNPLASFLRRQSQETLKIPVGLRCKIDRGKQKYGKVARRADDGTKDRRHITRDLARRTCKVYFLGAEKNPGTPCVARRSRTIWERP